jgi:hypothetical protein
MRLKAMVIVTMSLMEKLMDLMRVCAIAGITTNLPGNFSPIRVGSGSYTQM